MNTADITKTDYYSEVYSSCLDFLPEYIKYNCPDISDVSEFDWDDFRNECFNEDSVTGNASGSFFCNSYKAQQCLDNERWVYEEACDEFGISLEEIGQKFMDGDYEGMDVTCRCYVLDFVIQDMKNDMDAEDIIQEVVDANTSKEDEEEETESDEETDKTE